MIKDIIYEDSTIKASMLESNKPQEDVWLFQIKKNLIRHIV